MTARDDDRNAGSERRSPDDLRRALAAELRTTPTLAAYHRLHSIAFGLGEFVDTPAEVRLLALLNILSIAGVDGADECIADAEAQVLIANADRPRERPEQPRDNEREALDLMDKIRAQLLEERSAPSLTDMAEIVRQLVVDLWPRLDSLRSGELAALALTAVTLELRGRESSVRFS